MSDTASYEKPGRPEFYLTPTQVRQKKDDIEICDAKLASPVIEEKAQVREQRQLAMKALEEQAPPELNEIERDKVSLRVKELRDSIREGMPTAEEMRKKPPGAVSKHQSWERSKKQEVFEYRRGLRMLDPENTESEYTSVEHLRPPSNSLNLDNAFIPGKNFDFPSEQYMANFDSIFRKEEPVDNSLAEMVAEQQQQINELKEIVDRTRIVKRKTTGWTAEKRAEHSRKAKERYEVGMEKHRQEQLDEAEPGPEIELEAPIESVAEIQEA